MLVLSRKRNQSIMVGDDVEIIIVSVDRDQVKLGIKAPREIAVHRAEVYQEIKQANEAAAATGREEGKMGIATSVELKSMKQSSTAADSGNRNSERNAAQNPEDSKDSETASADLDIVSHSASAPAGA